MTRTFLTLLAALNTIGATQAPTTHRLEQTPPGKKGPGGHILTGPVFVEGAEPGDALEVKILSIDLAIPYGYNGCSGFVRENCGGPHPAKIIPHDRQTMTATFAPGIVIPLHPFFGSMGVAPPP